MSKITTLDAKNFKSEILKGQQPVLVDFWASWCGPCLMLAPVLEKIAVRYQNKLKVCKLNVDENQGIAAEYQIMSIPCLIMFKNGKEAGRVIGFLDERKLSLKINELL
jgi:thioredoxin 1